MLPLRSPVESLKGVRLKAAHTHTHTPMTHRPTTTLALRTSVSA